MDFGKSLDEVLAARFDFDQIEGLIRDIARMINRKLSNTLGEIRERTSACQLRSHSLFRTKSTYTRGTLL